MSDPVRYIVLTEAPDRHHVAVARSNPATGWVQIVATFARLSRAADYAAMEEAMVDEHDDAFRVEDHEEPPVIQEPHGGAGHAVEIIERSRETTRMVSYTTARGRERPAGALFNEILSELPALLSEFPKGPTARIFAERLCVDEYFVRRALREIASEQKAVLMRRRDSSAQHLVPLDYDPPQEELTPTQRAVFDLMAQLVDSNGIVDVPKRQIAARSGCPTGSIQMILDSLERKGRITGVNVQRGTDLPSVYRVVPERVEVRTEAAA